MAKMIKCKTCGADIARTAKVCPSCGAKQRKKVHIVVALILILALIGVFGAIAGNSDDPQKIGTVSNAPTPTETSSNQEDVFRVGDVVSLNGVNVTLLSVNEDGGNQFLKPNSGNVFVVLEFDIDNQSDSEIAVSSLMSFSAYFDDYSTNISIGAMTTSNKSQLDGSVAAGRKMTGVVGYEVPDDWNKVEIRFTPDFWSGKDIIFEYEK